MQVREFVKHYRRIAVFGLPADENSEAVLRIRRLLAYDFWVEDAPLGEELASLLTQEGIHVVAERSLEQEFARL